MEKLVLTDELFEFFDDNAKAIVTDPNRTKSYGVEGLAVGDTFIITPNSKGKLFLGKDFESNGTTRQFLRVCCEGDRTNITMTALMGTSKPNKYFNSDDYTPEFAPGYNKEKALAAAWKPESRDEQTILPILCTKYIGATFTCIAVVTFQTEFEGVVSDSAYYLFKCDMPKNE